MDSVTGLEAFAIFGAVGTKMDGVAVVSTNEAGALFAIEAINGASEFLHFEAEVIRVAFLE